MPVSQLVSVMDRNEFNGWLAFYQVEPFGPDTEDRHFAQLTASVFQSQGVDIKAETFRLGKEMIVETGTDNRKAEADLAAYCVLNCPAKW